jgi:hypothetical protein
MRHPQDFVCLRFQWGHPLVKHVAQTVNCVSRIIWVFSIEACIISHFPYRAHCCRPTKDYFPLWRWEGINPDPEHITRVLWRPNHAKGTHQHLPKRPGQCAVFHYLICTTKVSSFSLKNYLLWGYYFYSPSRWKFSLSITSILVFQINLLG